MLEPTPISADGKLGPVARTPNGLLLCYEDTPNTITNTLDPLGPQRIAGRFSADGGCTWSQPRTLVESTEAPGAAVGPVILGDETGRMNLLWLRFYTHGDLTPETARCEVWHAGSTDGGTTWSPPAQVDFGHTYTGALNSLVRLSTGRLLAPLSYMTARETGKFVSMVVYSDDDGATWQCCETDLAAGEDEQAGGMGESGMLEPVVVELNDGRVWMIIRTTLGRLYESVSEDAGLNWSSPQPTAFETSNAPAGILRLRDGRLVIAWNNCFGEPFIGGVSYARQALHGAISDDDGQTWTQPALLMQKADHEPIHAQYCYPFLIETDPGRVLTMYHRIGTQEGEDWSNPTRQLLHFDVEHLL